MIMYGKTDTGKVRSNNQDTFLIRQIGQTSSLAVVCDGMGGANGGNVASALAAETFADAVEELVPKAASPLDYPTVLEMALARANSAVFERAKAEPALAGMGTTLVAVLVCGKRFYAVTVGDSRLYQVNGGILTQLSHDHSYVQALVDSGSITEEESRRHPQKNVITRAVGTQESVEGDYYDLDFYADALLLCSDGLTGFVDTDGLNGLFSCHNDVEELTDALIRAANDGGGGDNITALVIQRD